MDDTVGTARPATHRLTVLDASSVTPMMRRIRVSAPLLARGPLRPAQDVGLLLTDDAGRPVRRRYTVTNVDPVAGTVVLDGVLHGDGPGARWFATAAAGDEVDAFGPRSGIDVLPADWYLLCSDESGLPAVSELATRLAGPVIALLEVDDAREEQSELAQPDQRARRELHWLHRNARRPGRPDGFAAAIDRLGWPAGTGYAYVLGESRAVAALKPTLAGAGFAPDRCYVKGYWNRPRSG